jgi:hypothetical protein
MRDRPCSLQKAPAFALAGFGEAAVVGVGASTIARVL